MATLSGSRIFTVGGTAYVWEDAVLAAHLWGDWTALEQQVRDGLACLARLDEDDEDGLDEADVDAAGTEFRYARDLVAAADLEAWLDGRGLTVDAWLDFIRRTLLVSRWANDLDEIRETYEIDDDEVAEAILCEAICSGLARRRAGRRRTRQRAGARDRALRAGGSPLDRGGGRRGGAIRRNGRVVAGRRRAGRAGRAARRPAGRRRRAGQRQAGSPRPASGRQAAAFRRR